MDGIKPNKIKATVKVPKPGNPAVKSVALDAADLPKSEGEKLSLNNLIKSKNPAAVVDLAEKEVPETLGNDVKTAIAKTGAAGISKRILAAGIIGVPMDAMINSLDYHSGKTDARHYAGKTTGRFLNWSAFEAGDIAAVALASAVIGRKLGPFGSMSIGVGTGILTASIYQRTVGYHVDEKLSKIIPESIARPFADTMDKYFAKPVDKYLLTPIKEHPKTSIAVGVALATALTIKYPVGFGLKFLAGTAGAAGISLAGKTVLNKILPDPGQKNADPINKTSLPSLDTPPTQAELEWAVPLEEKYRKDKSSVSDTDALKYLNILQRYQKP
jgi:hypothetical protein